VLGLTQVSVHANFFELGGNSLLATQIMSRTRDAFKIQLPLRLLFDEPTIAGLAREVERVARRSAEQDTKIRRVARGSKSLQHLLDELKQPAS
jgi:acyl carrier protein